MHPSSRLKTLAKDDERIAITGFVDDVRPEVGSAALYICPILDGGGTRLKLLDAMALGKAIVATPLAVEGLDLQDGRDVVVREFGAPFIDSVLTLLDDDDRRAALAGEARRTAVARYSWTEIGAKLRSVYAEALAEFSQRVREDSLA
jgi:glycosyltransferase involved in cell wall biosynthesis